MGQGIGSGLIGINAGVAPPPPPQKPGKSRQDYETPDELILAVSRSFGLVAFDLAATEQNKKADRYFSPEDDALSQKWDVTYRALLNPGEVMWLNPPFAHIRPWAEKCVFEGAKGARVVMLMPNGADSDWFIEIVQPRALALDLNPRVTFVGETQGYPKGLMISLFGFGMVGRGSWRWRTALR